MPNRPEAGRRAFYESTPVPDFADRVAEGYAPALQACRDVIQDRIEAGCPARDLAPLASVAQLIDKHLAAYKEANSS